MSLIFGNITKLNQSIKNWNKILGTNKILVCNFLNMPGKKKKNKVGKTDANFEKDSKWRVNCWQG